MLNPPENNVGAPPSIPPALRNCLSLDLEMDQDSRLIAMAAYRPDTGDELHFEGDHARHPASIRRIDQLSRGAAFIMGHNILKFDVPHLRAINPDLGLLRLPVVDTLWLNPLAYPRRPYHHLVKHYKDGGLVRQTRNNPLLDSKLAFDVLTNQVRQFRRTPPDLLAAYHHLCTSRGEPGPDMVFTALREAPRPDAAGAADCIRNLLQGRACTAAVETAIANIPRLGWETAFALAWINLEERDSSLAPWVIHQFPGAHRTIRALRGSPCAGPGCKWCRERHNPEAELKRWFGFDDFRPEPSTPEGDSLQRKIVASALARQDQLAILPTGAGKSLCYQLPALTRYDQTGEMTVVISPLVALMEDQVRNMQQVHLGCVTLNHLLSPQERKENIDQVRQGQASILLISPEQLRSRTVNNILETRKVGLWVLDEAHCLSKWGHDFRPDYRYIGRWIARRYTGDERGTILCLTATAKPDVEREITGYFTETLNLRLEVLDGGAERENLDFVVMQTTNATKMDHIRQVLEDELTGQPDGGVIIYCSRRRHTEDIANFLNSAGMKASHFHAGLSPDEKRETQERFISGDLRILAATNAFGMGIDKPDVRLVLHSDIPGSLENYMQEAGRAGRDQQNARCILLYTPEDTEQQFSLNARSRISRQEIESVLRALRRLDERTKQKTDIVATPGEILAEDAEGDFQRDTVSDDTRVRTAVAWLEEAALAARLENEVRVHPASLKVPNQGAARERLERIPGMDGVTRNKALDIVRRVLNAPPDQGITTDELANLTALSSRQVQSMLQMLHQAGILSDDQAITCFVHQGVAGHSRDRYQHAARMEQDLIRHMEEHAPDQDIGEAQPLHLREASSALQQAGHPGALPLKVQNSLRSISQDGRYASARESPEAAGGTPGQGNIRLRNTGNETIQVTLRQGWSRIEADAGERRRDADRILGFLLAQLPQGVRGKDLMVDTTRGDLRDALTQAQNGHHNGPNGRNRQATDHRLDNAMLWLHHQQVIRLNRGLGIFTPAMTIRLEKEGGHFTNADYEPLQNYYDAQTVQIHIMAEYARRGLESTADAIRLTMDYFSMEQPDFLKKWLPNRESELQRQTTQESFRRIVTDLNHRTQQNIVSDDRVQTSVLIIAGPGAGKTRVLVHRIAYLIRCKREPAGSIIALAYNRHAAVEIRQRLHELIGEDARGVLVMTLHSLAMRLTGETFGQVITGSQTSDKQPAAPADSRQETESYFTAMLQRAVALLGDRNAGDPEQDELRDRLLAGFRWILVDEYQDMNELQYQLISALAGRTKNDPGQKLSVFAVGDDDQNIYAFQGASAEYIRRFESDYNARRTYLTENYRSTRAIISAANHAIEPAKGRMKAGEPIRVNRRREREESGGVWKAMDPVAQGRVQVVPAGSKHVTQGQLALRELRRLENQDPLNWDWSRVAIIGRNWEELETVAGLCEMDNVDVQLAYEDFTATWQLRETQALIQSVGKEPDKVVSPGRLAELLQAQAQNRWTEMLEEALADHALEVGEARQPAGEFLHWLGEWARESRRKQKRLLLTTAHRAKGLEFDHVVILDGKWDGATPREDPDAPRRLYYVAMTRARQTLTLMRLDNPSGFVSQLAGRPEVLQRDRAAEMPDPPENLPTLRRRLRLSDVNLSFAGYRNPRHAVHQAIAQLQPGDPLDINTTASPWELISQGETVGRLARGFPTAGITGRIEARVLAVCTWNRDKSEGEHRDRLRTNEWEVVVPEILSL